MKTTFRRIRSFVQKLAKMGSLSGEESLLAKDLVVGISKTGSCKISNIARTKNMSGSLREIARPIYDGLADCHSKIERLRKAWLSSGHPINDQ